MCSALSVPPPSCGISEWPPRGRTVEPCEAPESPSGIRTGLEAPRTRDQALACPGHDRRPDLGTCLAPLTRHGTPSSRDEAMAPGSFPAPTKTGPAMTASSVRSRRAADSRFSGHSQRGMRNRWSSSTKAWTVRRPYRRSRMARSQSKISLPSSPSSPVYFPRAVTSSAVICRIAYIAMIFLHLVIPLDMPSFVPLRSSG